MGKIKDVIKAIEEFAPRSLQGDFDNCGLKLGDVENELHGVLVTLDTNEAVVDEAIAKNCNLIIEHHPSIFHAVKKFDYALPLTKAMTKAIKNDIAIYSAHTNVDFADDGLNDYAAKQLGLLNVRKTGEPCDPRMGELEKEVTLEEFYQTVKKTYNDKNATYIGDPNKNIRRVAVVNGGGGSHEDDLLTAVRSGADVFVTGDVKYSVARLAKDAGYAIIQVGHYDSEQGFSDLMSDLLEKVIGKEKIYKATTLLNPYN